VAHRRELAWRDFAFPQTSVKRCVSSKLVTLRFLSGMSLSLMTSQRIASPDRPGDFYMTRSCFTPMLHGKVVQPQTPLGCLPRLSSEANVAACWSKRNPKLTFFRRAKTAAMRAATDLDELLRERCAPPPAFPLSPRTAGARQSPHPRLGGW
jgi:hypothetical protein